jgi:alpha-mannosidase
MTKRALQTILARVNTSGPVGAVPVAVLNSLAWNRSEPVIVQLQLAKEPKAGFAVLDSAGKPLLFQILSKSTDTNSYRLLVRGRDVPSLGYQIWHVVPGTRDLQSDLKASGLTLENDLLRVVIDGRTGCITSLYDKRRKFESIANGGCANELETFKDTPKKYDAWNIDADFDKEVTKIDEADSVELIERGPVRATIRIVRTWQKSKFVQDVSLYAGMDRVDVFNTIDWHETHVLLKAAFPLAASSRHATYEIPYGSIERPTTRNNSWENAKFEVPALRWADLGDESHGFSLINESKYGYDDKDNVLRLSLLRSPTWPDPEADRGHHEFSYALYPHSGDWKQALTVRRGYEFNDPLRAFPVAAHEGQLAPQHSFLEVEGNHVVLTALKKTEDSSAILVRLYEWAGKGGDVQIVLPDGATAATLTNLQEQPIGDPLPISAKQVTVPVHPYEIVSVRISYSEPKSSNARPSSFDTQ